VRSLLLATKQLQEVLHQWSAGQVTETDVSDVYVRIGTDFNHTLHAFAYHNIDMRFVFFLGPLFYSLAEYLSDDNLDRRLAISTLSQKIFVTFWNDVSAKIPPQSCWECICPKCDRSCTDYSKVCNLNSTHGRL